MNEMLQSVFLNPWLILLLLLVTFVVITRIAFKLGEYPGYALGILIGVFFILVYISLSGETDADVATTEARLTIFGIFGATFLGLFFGGVIMVGLYFGTRIAQGISLQVASYTAINLILIFLTVFAGTTMQRMIGIFAVSIGISSLLGMVLFPDVLRKAGMPAQSVDGDKNKLDTQAQKKLSRLDEIRQNMQHKNPKV